MCKKIFISFMTIVVFALSSCSQKTTSEKVKEKPTTVETNEGVVTTMLDDIIESTSHTQKEENNELSYTISDVKLEEKYDVNGDAYHNNLYCVINRTIPEFSFVKTDASNELFHNEVEKNLAEAFSSFRSNFLQNELRNITDDTANKVLAYTVNSSYKVIEKNNYFLTISFSDTITWAETQEQTSITSNITYEIGTGKTLSYEKLIGYQNFKSIAIDYIKKHYNLVSRNRNFLSYADLYDNFELADCYLTHDDICIKCSNVVNVDANEESSTFHIPFRDIDFLLDESFRDILGINEPQSNCLSMSKEKYLLYNHVKNEISNNNDFIQQVNYEASENDGRNMTVQYYPSGLLSAYFNAPNELITIELYSDDMGDYRGVVISNAGSYNIIVKKYKLKGESVSKTSEIQLERGISLFGITNFSIVDNYLCVTSYDSASSYMYSYMTLVDIEDTELKEVYSVGTIAREYTSDTWIFSDGVEKHGVVSNGNELQKYTSNISINSHTDKGFSCQCDGNTIANLSMYTLDVYPIAASSIHWNDYTDFAFYIRKLDLFKNT